MGTPSVNACTFCKRGKRKCNKTRPSCSNCTRLGKKCEYIEDTIQTHFEHATGVRPSQAGSALPRQRVIDALFDARQFNLDAAPHSIVDFARQIIGSSEEMLSVSAEFFTGTHQRIPALSKLRFQQNLQHLTTGLRADFAVLCLGIILIQQYPVGRRTTALSSLYLSVKNLINLLEAVDTRSLDLLHCKVLVAYYEMGHALHTAAYVSVASAARTARTLGLHRKPWRSAGPDADRLIMEEEKRTWWGIVNMERFIGLCNGDSLFVTEDPERMDPLPIEDLLWSETSTPADIEPLISAPPSLDTPFNITVGQMARECQIAHLAGRVVRCVFDPTPDPSFNSQEAMQLERTLNSYLPLLADEELRIGKYCGAFGVCNSALFTLYEFMLRQASTDIAERRRILRCIEETSLRAITFAEAAYKEREESYPFEIHSPYLPYSLCQAAIVQYRLWIQGGDIQNKRNVDLLKSIIREFTNRWRVAWQYLDHLEKLNENSLLTAVPFQGFFISTGSRQT
ncbi:hypothetical protein QBC47DRAFT_336407 [Echria macrotheca]|uniref:Zn(2)-C6 fungal-type domain-containing protein n=1 Tax=Echria macrotheca TaxID=438768 RepID=A0AAJ0BKQ1_9PEZI|nr:hypothetical protein QBC47DRAFT_336407 [Echria macrotheca]